MKKILMVAYSFPPVAMNRSRRAVKLAKYLSAFDWETYVLTVKNPFVLEYNYEFQKESLKNIRIFRTTSLVVNFARIKTKQKNSYESRVSHLREMNNIFINLIIKLKDFIFYPDNRILWLPSALITGMRVIKREKILAIMVIGEPFSSFLIGVLLKLITGRFLIIDFRDEWVGFNQFRYPKRPRLLCKIDKIVEKIVIKKADIITVTTEEIKKNFISRYLEYQNKFYCLSNGFDQDDFLGINKVKHSDNQKLVITYCGSVYEGRTIRFFLKALEELIAEYPQYKDVIKFIFVGTKDSKESIFFEKNIFNNLIDNIGFLSYEKTLEKMIQSDLLLCLEENNKIVARRYIPGKIYEYLASRTPIIALVSEGGEAASLIRKTNSGIIIPPEDIDGIKSFLIYALEKKRNREDLNFKFEEEEIEKLSYFNSSKALASWLDKKVGTTPINA